MEKPVPKNLVLDITLSLEDHNLLNLLNKLNKLPREITHILKSKISPFHSAQFYIRTGRLLKYDYEDFRVLCVKNKVDKSYNLEGNWILTFHNFMQKADEATKSAICRYIGSSVTEFLNDPDFNPYPVTLNTTVYVKENETFVCGTDVLQVYDGIIDDLDYGDECVVEVGSLNPEAAVPDDVSERFMSYVSFVNLKVSEIDLDVNGLFYFLLLSPNGTRIMCKDLSSEEDAGEVFNVNHPPVIEQHEVKQMMLAVDGDHVFIFIRTFNALHYFNKATREQVTKQVDGDREITERMYALGPNAIIFCASGFRIVNFQASGDPSSPIPRCDYPLISYSFISMMDRSILYKESVVDGYSHLKIIYLIGDQLTSRNLFLCHPDDKIRVSSCQLFQIDGRETNQTSKYFLEAPQAEPILFYTGKTKTYPVSSRWL
ncbi:unnamed protein product [Bursaphelenchus xylophilus]|uniref:(pine wood nematode) hypothetical protein n=1 Tax=Bursaphelenchus xylophilus TaxID=6326 RepID=A0A7I8WX30_BURXY|nr:unnamed protein product [Bursaphelenchus xylophilus]CAG9100086.1 unnamed protein product [Bursaphelenchus xylophilus]